jgi:hypothetical protein
MRRVYTGLVLGICLTSFASLDPRSVPRSALQTFRKEGLFEGGRFNSKANVEDIRLSDPNHDGFERWIIDFSDLKRVWGSVAPKFQLRYSPADRVELPEGKTLIKKQAMFSLLLQGIQKNFITDDQIHEALQKSKYVKKVVVYPQVEHGDMAMEMILRDDVIFKPHQPMEREGRLVLDLRDAPQKMQ